MNILKQLALFKQELTAVIFPELCSYCHTEMYNNTVLCHRCIQKLPYTHYEKIKDNEIEKLFWGRIKFEKAFSLFYMYKEGIVHELIHQLKYKQRTDIGEWLGTLMANKLELLQGISSIDTIVPIPLNKKKEQKRGYNQSHIIAQTLAKQLDKEYIPHALIRTTNSATQTKKTRLERLQNVHGIFEVHKPEQLKYKHVLIIDDVITTGATIEACAKLLAQIDGTVVSIASVGIAMK